MKVLSLFDGMACGMIAMQLAGVEVESYDAYEVDKYAIKTAQHNSPMIEEHGDVFKADFTQYEGVDFLVGGSPCTYWSIAQTKNRETVASGMGWELFSQYVRALKEAKPKYFIYENNKSMSKQIRASIDETFGFGAVLINSALVSAQNRQRLYWVGRRNADGTYSKVNVEQPADRGILLKDVLDSAVAMRGQSNGRGAELVAEPLTTTKGGKSFAITANYVNIQDFPNDYAAHTIEKSVKPLVAEPILEDFPPFVDERIDNIVEKVGHYPEMWNPYNNAEITEKAPTQTAQCASWTNSSTCVVAEPITGICQVGAMPMPNSELSTSAGFRVYSTEAKGRYLCANGGGAGAKTGLYAIPCAIEFDENGRPIKAINADGKEITIYEVKDGKITIKEKQYPIKLRDGYYIIRKLTVSECKRLQTVPEWYDFSCVSNSQAYKMLGNGWTCEVITHLIKSCLTDKPEEYRCNETEAGMQYTLF